MMKNAQDSTSPSNADTRPDISPGITKGVLAIVRRHGLVWWAHVLPALTSNIASPLLYLFALGFGLGAVVKSVGDVPYLVFVLPGVAANSSFFSASFEGAINSFSRMSRERVYAGILSTPVRLIEILVADALFAAAKGTLSGASVLLVGFMVGGVQAPLMILPAILLIFIGCFFFACIGLFLMSFAKTNEFFSYFFTFWVAPSFLFCGVFFEVTRFPEWVQHIAWALPMTHFIHTVRPLMVPGMTIAPGEAAWYISYVILFGGVCLFLAHKRLKKRLLDQ